MKHEISKQIAVPEGIICTFEKSVLKCVKDSSTSEREIKIPLINVKIENNSITLECKRGNKNTNKVMSSLLAHIRNILAGLQKEFVYKLESCNVHFPMTLKVEGDRLIINNFLGEKIPRSAKILPNVKVEIRGQLITISSSNKEAAGQTAANFEKATKIKGRDRRIYQDGIFITEKPRREF